MQIRIDRKPVHTDTRSEETAEDRARKAATPFKSRRPKPYSLLINYPDGDAAPDSRQFFFDSALELAEAIMEIYEPEKKALITDVINKVQHAPKV